MNDSTCQVNDRLLVRPLSVITILFKEIVRQAHVSDDIDRCQREGQLHKREAVPGRSCNSLI